MHEKGLGRMRHASTLCIILGVFFGLLTLVWTLYLWPALVGESTCVASVMYGYCYRQVATLSQLVIEGTLSAATLTVLWAWRILPGDAPTKHMPQQKP